MRPSSMGEIPLEAATAWAGGAAPAVADVAGSGCRAILRFAVAVSHVMSVMKTTSLRAVGEPRAAQRLPLREEVVVDDPETPAQFATASKESNVRISAADGCICMAAGATGGLRQLRV